MPNERRCPRCGQSLTGTGLAGLCPGCLLQKAMETRGTGDDGLSTGTECPRPFGDFVLEREIARGGMGVVFRARQISLSRTVAVKMILSGHFADRQALQRFRMEAEAAARLSHSNIVPIHEAGEHEGQAYFAMDFVDGCPLAELVRDQPLPPHRAAQYLLAVAKGVQYAHENGILHRDLKPSNILIDSSDQPRITDFGLAKRIGEDTDCTLTGHALGSPHYMSPEQAEARHAAVGPQSDVYSLGAVLFHLITARPPFLGESVAATIAQVTAQDPVSPRQLNSRVPRDLETICLKCLEKDPARRYASAGELADELARFLDDEPIQARPVGSMGKLWRWTRRNPRVAGLSASLILAVLAGLVTATSEWRRAEQLARTERAHRQQLQHALTLKEIETAESQFRNGDVSSALARLARVLRDDPASRIAATRLLSALTWRNFPLPVTPPLAHQDAVLSARFSPDGRMIVTASGDGTAAIWSASDGRQLAAVQHQGAVRYAEFSPDGQRIVTASVDSTARIWIARTGEPMTPPLEHEARIRRARFSPDGRLVATASADGTARLWDGRTGKPVARTLRHGNAVNDAVFSPDGRRVLTCSNDDTSAVWDVSSGQRLFEPLQHSGDVWAAEFSPDGNRIATASDDWSARVWDATTGTPVTAALRHDALVNLVRFNSDGSRIVTASWDDTARVWDARTGQPITTPIDADSDVLFAAFSPDDDRILTISDANARVWDAHTGQPLNEPMSHEKPLRHLGDFSPDGKRALTTSLDGTAIVWDISGQPAQPRVLEGREASRALACSPDGRWIAGARGREFTMRIWDAQSGEIVGRPLQHEGLVVKAEFSSDGRRLLTASRDGQARIWSVPAGELVAPPMPHSEPLRWVSLGADGTRVISASEDKTSRIWNAATGEAMTPALRHEGYVAWAEFSPDGGLAVTASGDGTARVWNTMTGAPIGLPLRHEVGLQVARFSSDGFRIVTASEDGTARIWDTKTFKPMGPPLRHQGHVRWAEFSPDARWLLTTSLDKTARIWDAKTGEPITPPIRHRAGVISGHFSPDSRRFVTVSLDPVVRVYDVATGLFLSDGLRHEAKVEFIAFLPDGDRIATVGGERLLRIWDVPAPPLPVPDWLPELAEALAGTRVDARGRSTTVSAKQLAGFRRRFQSGSARGFYERWAAWFFADRDQRSPSPFSQFPPTPLPATDQPSSPSGD